MNYVELIQQEYKWADLPWKKFEKVLYKLQKRIYQASSRGDVKNVRRLQKLLIKSRSAKLIAVRRVTQDNQGCKTAGIDGVKTLTPKQRLTLVDKITLSSKAQPVRRVWIPKPGKEEKRPLGIPTMKERAVQCLTKFALEPEWEAKFEPNSYGFRPGRSCHDVREAIHNAICTSPKYVLDADISQCFDKINHEKLIRKINTFPTLRRQIRAWLKAGVWDNKELFPTSEGTPQGGVISPLLANIALHGMEECVKIFAETLTIFNENGNKVKGKRDKRRTVSLIRYADDFVILHKDYSVVLRCREIISRWLKDMGLELKPSKTRLTHTLHNVGKEKAGFDFLGFNICQYKVGKYTSGKNKQGNPLGFKTIIKPSKKSIQNHYRQIAGIIENSKSFKQGALIRKLNPIIRGWSNYFSTSVSKKIFYKLDHLIWWKLWKWSKGRHRKKGNKWLKNKYFPTEITFNNNSQELKIRRWTFATTKDGKVDYRLTLHGDTEIKRHIRVKTEASPYDGNLTYWSSRMGKHPLMPVRKAKLLKTQKGKCNWCNLTFREDDVIEIDHSTPTAIGGKDEHKNLQLLHKHCHDAKTKIDLGIIQEYKSKVRIEQLYKWFNKLNWIWVDDIPTMV